MWFLLVLQGFLFKRKPWGRFKLAHTRAGVLIWEYPVFLSCAVFFFLYRNSYSIFSGPSPGPFFDLGTKSRGIKLPRDFNGIFCTGSGNHGTEILFVRDPATTGLKFCLYGIRQPRDCTIFSYGIRPPRYSPGRDVATTGRNGIWLNGIQPRRDSTGFFVRDPATAGLPGRDAATTGLDEIFLMDAATAGLASNMPR